MIPKHLRITAGMIARHDEGLLYQVDDVRKSTEDYEITRQLDGQAVNYTQLEDGHFPAGTKWSKGEQAFRRFFTLVRDKELVAAKRLANALQAGSNEPELAPFSLVLGPSFRPSPSPSALSNGDKEVRERLKSLIGPSNPQMLGRMANILAEGQIRFRDIPEIEPHLGKGATFNDPARLYREWGIREDVGPGLDEAMRTLIVNASRPQPIK